MQRLAEKMGKGSKSYADTVNYIHTVLSFYQIRSSIHRSRDCSSMEKNEPIEFSHTAITEEGRPFVQLQIFNKRTIYDFCTMQ